MFTAGDFNGDTIDDLSAYRSDGLVWTAQIRLALAAPNTTGSGTADPVMACAAQAFVIYQSCVLDASIDPHPASRSERVALCTAEYEDNLRRCVGVIAR
jgi:hypothetical protein